MKIGTIVHLPSTSYGCSQVFNSNLRQFKTRFDLVTYSAFDWPDLTVKLPAPPDVAKDAHKYATNNLAFYTGLRVALKLGYTHVIYLEVDCRIGRDYWDEVIFEEYFNLGRPTIVAGTLACYNPCNYSRLAATRWNEVIANNSRRNFPVATYGWVPAAEKHPTCVFSNGALSVIDIRWMETLFDLSNTYKLATAKQVWDMAIGVEIWKRFEEQAFDMVGFLKCIYSGYGDLLTSEAERLEMLRSGKIVAVHQVKSNQTI